MKLLTVLLVATLAVALPAHAQDRTFSDGCNTIRCDANGSCLSTALSCQHIAQDAPIARTVARLALGAVVVTSAADATVSAYNIGAGRARELNPILAPFADRPGWYGAIKATETAAIVAVLDRYRGEHPKLIAIVGAGIAGAQLAVVVHNAGLGRAP